MVCSPSKEILNLIDILELSPSYSFVVRKCGCKYRFSVSATIRGKGDAERLIAKLLGNQSSGFDLEVVQLEGESG